jgi:hypothetical protein
MVRRIQIYIEEAVDDALAREALARRTSKAALIREYVGSHMAREPANGADPSDALVGAYEGERDESQGIDQVVYGR